MRQMRKLLSAAFCGALVITVQVASADDLRRVVRDNVTGTSQAEGFSFKSVTDKMALSYMGVYRGAGLSDLGSTYQPAVDGSSDKTSGQHIENIVRLGVRPTSDTIVGLQGHFYAYPVGKAETDRGNKFEMWDPSLYLQKNAMVDSSGFRLDGRLNLTLPTSNPDILRTQHLATSLFATAIGNYQVPKTALTVGFFGFVAGYMPSNDTLADARTYKIYFAPTASYQISKRVAATLWIDLISAARNRGTGFFSGLKNAPIDIEPGISWDITDYLTVNPQLNIYPETPTLAATSIQMNVIAKAF